jgi:molybdopterin/thiamine biosynthesis adenylyltransferase
MEASITPADEDRMDRSRRIEWLDIEAVESAKMLVVGAGAIGNEVLKNLVLSGFKDITIVDMDRVAISNLNRCVLFREKDASDRRPKAEVAAERLRELDGSVKITVHTREIQKIPEDIFQASDVVFGCLDNILARIHLNAHSWHYGVPYVDGGTRGFIGKVQVVMPPETPCIECGLNKSHMEVLEKRFSCTGRDVTYVEPVLPAEITTTSIVAAVQVREALKIVSGRGESAVRGLFYYDGQTNTSEILELDINPDCPHHG